MGKDARNIYYYDVHSRVWSRRYSAGQLTPFPHHVLATVVEKLFKASKAEVTQPKSKQAIYISDMKVFSDRAEILIGYCDPTAADPTLVDRPKRKRRVVNKIDDEGLEHSAHVIWHYVSKTNEAACSFYLEGATGLGSTAIVRFINRLLRLAAKGSNKFDLPDPEGTVDAAGNFKTIKTRPRIELTGHPSKEFIRDLTKGTLTEVEIYTESDKDKPWDANAYALEDRKSVLIKPNDKKTLPNPFRLLKGVFSSKTTSQYEYARVSFKTETNVARSARIFSSNFNLINDDRYVRKEVVTFAGAALPNSFDAFHLPIVKAVRKLAGI